MEHFAEIGNSFQPLTIFAKHSVSDVWQISEYAFDTYLPNPQMSKISGFFMAVLSRNTEHKMKENM